MKPAAICLLSVIVCFFATVTLHAADVAGSRDHPLVTRYPGSSITWYETQAFDKYRIAVGPVTGYRTIDKWVETQGKVTRINYTLKGVRSVQEVFANYLSAVKKAGFSVLAEGSDKSLSAQGKVGQRGFLTVHYAANPTPPGASQLLSGSSTSGGSGYFAARLQRPAGTVFVVVGATQYKEDEVVVLVDVIEQRAMEDDLIAVDAAAMSKDLAAYGKVALYGIHFDHDKATIRPESKAALTEIATLLKNQPALNVYVVGHTDGQGTTEYNMRLSLERARAVTDTLTKDYGIAAGRLEPHGVGPLVPVATNQGDPGRAKNRRVELVQR